MSWDLSKLILFEDRGAHIYSMILDQTNFYIDMSSEVFVNKYLKDIIYTPLWNNKLLKDQPWMKSDAILINSSTSGQAQMLSGEAITPIAIESKFAKKQKLKLNIFEPGKL